MGFADYIQNMTIAAGMKLHNIAKFGTLTV
jgi:hypothetical protein